MSGAGPCGATPASSQQLVAAVAPRRRGLSLVQWCRLNQRPGIDLGAAEPDVGLAVGVEVLPWERPGPAAPLLKHGIYCHGYTLGS